MRAHRSSRGAAPTQRHRSSASPSLLSIIAVNEFTQMAREVNANTFSTLESYIPLAVGYLLLTLPISILTKGLERKYAYAD